MSNNIEQRTVIFSDMTVAKEKKWILMVGYGYMLDFLGLDSAPAVSADKHYLILSTKKTGR